MKIALLSVTTAALVAASPAGAADQKQRPLKLRETCVTKAERAHVLRFRASDRVRLVGVELGCGPRGVVLAHQGASDLCIWIPYARSLAARGYRVLVFDHRGVRLVGTRVALAKAEPGRLRRAGRDPRDPRPGRDERGHRRRLARRRGGALGGGAGAASVDGVISLASPAELRPHRPARGGRRRSGCPRSSSRTRRTAVPRGCPDAVRPRAPRRQAARDRPGCGARRSSCCAIRSVRALVDDFIARHSQ